MIGTVYVLACCDIDDYDLTVMGVHTSKQAALEAFDADYGLLDEWEVDEVGDMTGYDEEHMYVIQAVKVDEAAL